MDGVERNVIEGTLEKIEHRLQVIERRQVVLLEADAIILRQGKAILALLQPKPSTRHVAVVFTGDSIMASNNTLVFNVGQTAQASIAEFLTDGTTPSGGVPSNVAFAFNDPSATVVLNADGLTATCTGVAGSSGPVAGSVSCTITDTDGAVSQWTQPFTITTNAVTPPPPPPSQLTQSIAVVFSAPTP